MLLLTLSGCLAEIFFPPDLQRWDTGGWDSGRPNRGGQGDDDDTTPGPTDPPVLIDTVGVQCNPENTDWLFQALTTGWVSFGQLDVFRISDHSRETHGMSHVGADPGGAWDALQVGPLADGVDPATQQSTLNSRFDCVEDAETLTYVVRIRAGDGALLDCAVWGQDPPAATLLIREEDPDVLALGGCSVAVVSE